MNIISKDIIKWLLDSDVSIQYQVHRDLLNIDRPDLQNRISKEGWGLQFLQRQQLSGHWGSGFYQPKWTNTHYTLLDLKNLCIAPDTLAAKRAIDLIIKYETGMDGGINPSENIKQSDVCINGMFLNYASWFETQEESLKSVVDFILSQQMPDGGFNCRLNRSGATHSSLHSTISVMEGIREYFLKGYKYRLHELLEAERQSFHFLLEHKLFKSHRTGEIIDRKMLMLSHPSRWKYDILRALDYFQYADFKFHDGMKDAIDVLKNKQKKDGKWPLQAKHPGQTHFEMEKVGFPGKWNTLRALRVLYKYQ